MCQQLKDPSFTGWLVRKRQRGFSGSFYSACVCGAPGPLDPILPRELTAFTPLPPAGLWILFLALGIQPGAFPDLAGSEANPELGPQ